MTGLALVCACASSDPASFQPPLRVGTTGNAPPYSQRLDTSFVGIDIDLARDLGEWMGRPVEFVAVSWPTLLSELTEGRFDLAMSGIYITHEREMAGLFSEPYLLVGQQAVVHCDEVDRFQTLSDVNRAGVRVFVTEGGANEEFVRRALPNASFVPVDPDPREAARLIAQGEGDLAIGTTLGVQYFTQRDPRVCIGLGGSTVNENLAIGVLMARGSPHHPVVNRWIEARKQDGLIEQVVEAHLEGP